MAKKATSSKAGRVKKFNPKGVSFKNDITGSGQTFKFTKKGVTIEGLYQGAKKVKTRNGDQFIHSLINAKGETINFWNSTVLECLLAVKKDTPVQVKFMGKIGKGRRAYNSYTVKTA